MLYPFILTVAVPELVVLLDITFYSYLPTTQHIDRGTDSQRLQPYLRTS
jgi:hypothetical protein